MDLLRPVNSANNNVLLIERRKEEERYLYYDILGKLNETHGLGVILMNTLLLHDVAVGSLKTVKMEVQKQCIFSVFASYIDLC